MKRLQRDGRASRTLDWLLLAAIGFYQRRISPRKGWRCAHGVLHGGSSCSGVVQNAIRQYGWRAAWPLAKGQFAACKRAAQTLRAQKHPLETPDAFDAAPSKQSNRLKGKQKSKWDFCDCCHWCDPSFRGCANALFDCGPGDSGCIDCASCDCNPCS